MAPLTALLLEDDAVIGSVLEAFLADEGWRVTRCKSFEELVQSVRTSAADVAITDYWGNSYTELGDGDRQALQELQRHVPVIVITARSWAATESAETLGVSALVRKPFDLEDLEEALQRATN